MQGLGPPIELKRFDEHTRGFGIALGENEPRGIYDHHWRHANMALVFIA